MIVNVTTCATLWHGSHYSFSPLWNHAHNSENLKRMYQQQDPKLLNSKHNSFVFTHIEIQNHKITSFCVHAQITWLNTQVHRENTGLQNASPNYQFVSLTSQTQLAKTPIMCQSIKEASGDLYCVVLFLITITTNDQIHGLTWVSQGTIREREMGNRTSWSKRERKRHEHDRGREGKEERESRRVWGVREKEGERSRESERKRAIIHSKLTHM